MSQPTPLHKHDCTECHFYGTIKQPLGWADVYECKGTVVLRYSSDGPDYRSVSREFASMLGGEYAVALSIIINNGG